MSKCFPLFLWWYHKWTVGGRNNIPVRVKPLFRPGGESLDYRENTFYSSLTAMIQTCFCSRTQFIMYALLLKLPVSVTNSSSASVTGLALRRHRQHLNYKLQHIISFFPRESLTN